ncbi:hypothetical protein TcasGA2_TC000340 [Tribolium castaneum]|uniref:Uncharacterized protein n=1 Tax=Tribolium castaneum TaxID=7070 RepID=D6WAU2_TRICA|nr:hypothetical protein TcasGA2_TC000340 [Tribolium castaneum]
MYGNLSPEAIQVSSLPLKLQLGFIPYNGAPVDYDSAIYRLLINDETLCGIVWSRIRKKLDFEQPFVLETAKSLSKDKLTRNTRMGPLSSRRRTISEGGHLNKAGHEFAPFTGSLQVVHFYEYPVFDVSPIPDKRRFQHLASKNRSWHKCGRAIKERKSNSHFYSD